MPIRHATSICIFVLFFGVLPTYLQSCRALASITTLLHILTLSFPRSSSTSSIHLFQHIPLNLLPPDISRNTFFTALYTDIRWAYPAHLIHPSLITVTRSGTLIVHLGICSNPPCSINLNSSRDCSQNCLLPLHNPILLSFCHCSSFRSGLEMVL